MASLIILAAGILTVASAFFLPGKNPYQMIFPFFWFGGGAIVGAGIGNLFRYPGLGAIVGFAAQLGVVVVLFLVYLAFWPAIG